MISNRPWRGSRTLFPTLLTALGLLAGPAVLARTTVRGEVQDVRREILLQGFGWNSEAGGVGNWYDHLAAQASGIAGAGITSVWLPPPSKDGTGQAGNGYFPADYYDLGDLDQHGCRETRYGSRDELKACVRALHAAGVKALGDLVLNHRAATDKDPQGRWTIFHPRSGKAWWEAWSSPHFSDCRDTGSEFGTSDVCHSNPKVRQDQIEWVTWLQREIGYDGWRFDYSKGYSAEFAHEVLAATGLPFAVGEYWTSMSYQNGQLVGDQNQHRQLLVDWIKGTQEQAWAFDFTTKGLLQQAVNGEYWRLKGDDGRPAGLLGWWPGRSVTFVENHDTGSGQQHWPFPAGKVMQGYAYILTHPGIPTIFWEHFADPGLRPALEALIRSRKTAGVHAESSVQILEAKSDLYAARIGTKERGLVMKVGPSWWNPGAGWKLSTSGNDYAIWLPE